MTNLHTKYRSLRLKDEEFQRIKEIQRYLRRKGTDAVDWQELRRQNIIELPDDEAEDSNDDLTMGFVLGLGAAALAYLIWKSSQK
jgi:ribonuclease PH